MLKLRNAVLTALLAFCLAMPFVSCSFNDGATGDVSDKVTVQSDNNQNGGNENPSGSDNGGNGHEHPSGGDNGGNENPSGGNNGGSGNENPSGGNEKPVEGTMYTVMYNGQPLVDENGEVVKIPAVALSAYKQKYGLVEDTDYTINGNVITLTDSGLKKVMDAGAGEGGGQEPGTDEPGTDYPGTEYPGTDYPGTDYPGTDYPGTDYPGTDYPGTGEPGSGEVTEYTVKYNGKVLETISAEKFSEYSSLLTKDTDYTISGNVITLTDSGFEKGKAAGFGK